MSATSRRAIAAEFRGAALLHTTRVRRVLYKSTPDVEPVRLASGRLLQGEVKSRKRLPRWLRRALEQARGYLVGSVPVVLLFEPGGEPLALLTVRDLSRELGLSGSPLQLALVPQPNPKS